MRRTIRPRNFHRGVPRERIVALEQNRLARLFLRQAKYCLAGFLCGQRGYPRLNGKLLEEAYHAM